MTTAAPDLSPTAAAAMSSLIAPPSPDTGTLDVALAEAEEFLLHCPDPDLAAALASTQGGTECAPIDRQPWRDALPGADPVTPIANVDELVETLLQVVVPGPSR